MKGFKEFLLRGNLVEMAVAFIMAASFGAVVTAFTKLLLDIIGMFVGSPNFDNVKIGDIAIGPFLTALVAFIILAAVVYFGVVLPYNTLRDRFAKQKDEDEAKTAEDLLEEIRDVLVAQSGGTKPPVQQ